MPEISAITLMMAVQALDAKLAALGEEIKAERSDNILADLEEIYTGYWQAMIELRERYIEAAKISLNLPPFEELVTLDY